MGGAISTVREHVSGEDFELVDGASARALMHSLVQGSSCLRAAQAAALPQICANDLGDAAGAELSKLLAALHPIECLAAVYTAFLNGHKSTLELLYDYVGDTSTSILTRALRVAPGSVRDLEALTGLVLHALRQGEPDDLRAVLGLLPAARASDVEPFVICVREVLDLLGGPEREEAPHLVRELDAAYGLSDLQKWEILLGAAMMLDLEYAQLIEEALGRFDIAYFETQRHPPDDSNYETWLAGLEADLAFRAADAPTSPAEARAGRPAPSAAPLPETRAALLVLLGRHVRAE